MEPKQALTYAGTNGTNGRISEKINRTSSKHGELRLKAVDYVKNSLRNGGKAKRKERTRNRVSAVRRNSKPGFQLSRNNSKSAKTRRKRKRRYLKSRRHSPRHKGPRPTTKRKT